MWDTYKGNATEIVASLYFLSRDWQLHSPKIHATMPRIRQLATYENFRIEKFQLWQKLSNFASKHKNIP